MYKKKQSEYIIGVRPTHPNHSWVIDFVHNELSNDHNYKILTMLDEYTREALSVAVQLKMTENDVPNTLHHFNYEIWQD